MNYFKTVLATFLIAATILFSESSIAGSGDLNTGNWCRERLVTLKRAYKEAMFHYSYGQIERSVYELRQGLLEANANINPYFTGALTSKAIRRGVVIMDQLSIATEGDTLKTKTINLYLFEYYNFIMKVSKQLDMQYYTPRRDKCFFCKWWKHNKFEKLYVKFAKEQVKMVLDAMTTIDYLSGQGETVFPLGAASGYFKALELAVKYMSDDLKGSLYARKFACKIEQADYLAGKLELLDYPDEFIAVQRTYYAAADLVNSKHKNHCPKFGYDNGGTCQDHNNDGRTFTLDGSYFRIPAGESRTVQLPNMAIKNLWISAVGVGNDGMFDVFIDGKFKQNIHVPKYDPTFYIEIDGHAKSMTLVSKFKWGKVKISKIEIVPSQDHSDFGF